LGRNKRIQSGTAGNFSPIVDPYFENDLRMMIISTTILLSNLDKKNRRR
jgi:hypothetical protein